MLIFGTPFGKFELNGRGCVFAYSQPTVPDKFVVLWEPRYDEPKPHKLIETLDEEKSRDVRVGPFLAIITK